MKPISRLYSCILCHAQAAICSHCDRGHIYCSTTCSRSARLKSCRAAEKRYQLTLKGKMKHALRQQRYRIRQKEKVTDQGSIIHSRNVLLVEVKNETNEIDRKQVSQEKQCCICKKTVSSWFRKGFLRYGTAKLPRNLSYLRPP